MTGRKVWDTDFHLVKLMGAHAHLSSVSDTPSSIQNSEQWKALENLTAYAYDMPQCIQAALETRKGIQTKCG